MGVSSAKQPTHLASSSRWLNPLFKIGHEQKLKQDDMYSVFPEDRSQRLGEELQGYWDQEVLRAKTYKREPCLMKAIIKCYWKSCLVLGIFTFLENFLLLDEIPQVSTQLPSEGEVMVDMQDFTAFWDEESETPTLQGLSFTVRPGELLAVVGPMGAGRSSLLRTMLG
ncbi:ATP-binding cassette sub-family C member 4-like isoform X2 [Bos taurus]|uniref:ATP-binding cassette sub-family C member 4-like isoform X2 n=1 Tax=Bos taurus TaxID=9913 RepID=UPI0028CB62FC|nr:ATP-binding cassette sub-family C member 4-like isoform X2 [Bos taurus]